MRDLDERIGELKQASREVIRDCSLENGAIVAANSDKEYYPENVANYRFVWPRDAGFILYAADVLGLEGLESEFFDWLYGRAEGFEESGIIYHRYSTNGPRDTDFGHQYQPDQAAALLWATLETNDSLDEQQDEIVHLLADGLWKEWDGKSFVSRTHDLWEEREAFPEKNESFSYTLGACSEALYRAAARMGEKKWETAAEEMRKRLEQHVAERKGREYFPRSYGEISDETVDASALGLVWPFNVANSPERLEDTVELIEEELYSNTGVMRYRGDMYDGIVHQTNHLKKGAGSWPLLTFWLAIALEELGRYEDAREVFRHQVEKIDGRYIPEQIFDSDSKTSIEPLAWSHAMFVVAAERLEYL
ncbi:MAG: glycoside hydrolase family 15 protein [Candidatus Nanohaloarchaea archaeon]